MNVKRLIATLLWCVGPMNAGQAAGVFKCQSTAGHVTYQSMPCADEAEAETIDLRFTNMDAAGLDDEAAALIEDIHASRQQQRRLLIERRDASIRQRIDAHSARLARCEALKSAVSAMYARRRIAGVQDGDAVLIRRMREACAP